MAAASCLRKRVVFADTTEIIPITSPLQQFYDYNGDEAIWKSIVWYQADELTYFRNQARDVCRGMRLSTKQQQQQQLTICSDDVTRGLEQRSCVERQRRKYMTTRLIIKASRTAALDDQRLAEMAQKCNAWAGRLAREEAERDFGRAYNNNNKNSITSSILETPHPRKRLSSDREELEMATRRLVRTRV